MKVIDRDGTMYYRDARHCVHRKGSPAKIWPDGGAVWFWNGRAHRIFGPALLDPGGHQEWYRRGEKDRDSGPAVISPDGTRENWIYGMEIRSLVGF
jgi:hypothetical protein